MLAVGCAKSETAPEAANLTYSEALQKLAVEQRELTRLLEERAGKVATREKQAQDARASDEPPGRMKLNLAPQGEAKLEDVRLDLGPAHAEALRTAEQRHNESLQGLDAQIARQRERVKEAKAIKDSLDQ
jgi:hypothetical protein